MIFYTNWFIPKRFTGFTIGPVVLIRPQHADDLGLREHELTHVRQFYQTWGWNGIRYALSKKWRWHYEAEAFREQLKHSPDSRNLIAYFLSTKYNLGISIDQAKESLTEP